ncbi:MAG: nitroreductase family protein [Rhodospirillales bacterium]|nr:nitroreductase family protein [Rhodospirillales bacterium]MDE2319512.1 nitroreductase family protein [Rhodospirillales bacterium]
MTTANSRTADHPIDPIFLERWSPRAFTGEAISEHTLRTMFEAARWAPSSYNSQPWRFLYARRDNAHWDKFLGLLNPFNQSWAKTASALVFVVSSETMVVPGKDSPVPSHSHSFDAGAAWGYLALQATFMGWQAHGMAGIEMERVYTELKVPAGYRVECGVVIGRQGPKTLLPEALQAREAPSPRKPVTEIAFEGGF